MASPNLKTIIAENLRGYRKLENLTQEALAGRANVYPNYISRLERESEEVNPTPGTLVKLAKALKIEPYMLLIPHSYKKQVTITDKE